MRELSSVEMRIVERTLYLIGQKGTVDVPVRAIIKEANVNLGAINYYFETKEQLLSTVREFYTENMLKTMKYLEDARMSAEERLIGYANEVMTYSLDYPNSVVMMKDAYQNESKDAAAHKLTQTLKKVMHLLDSTLKEFVGEDEYEMKKMIFMSAMVYPMENNAQDEVYLESVGTKEKRIHFITCLLKMLQNFRCDQ